MAAGSSCRSICPTSTARRLSTAPRRTIEPSRGTPARQVELSFGDQNRIAAHSNRRDLAVLLVRFDVKETRSAHLESLLDDPAQHSVSARIARPQISAESSRGPARRGIFGHADARGEHPGAIARARQLGVRAKEKDLLR